MAFARDSYTASASQTDFTISFPYLSEDDVIVTKEGVTLTQGASNDYTFFDASTIRLTSGATSGDTVVITRSTSRSTRLTDYTPGPLTEAGLDNDSLQAFYMAQEAIDQAEIRLGEALDGKWDAESKIIKNVLDPTSDQDAATRKYVLDQVTGGGNVPAPADPGDDNKVLEANSGTFAWTAKDTAGDGIDRSSDTLSVDLATNPGLEFATAKLRAKLADGTLTRTAGGLAVNVGTGANQIVQLDGSSLLPAVDGSQLTNIVDIQTFTASGTWNKPSGGTLAIIEAIGGGGSGGQATGSAGGGGGGGGAYHIVRIPLSDLGATETVTIGAGGAARTTASDGAAGGNTTFGSHMTAFGGGGGADATGGGGGGGGLAAGTTATSNAGAAGGGPDGGSGGAAGSPGGVGTGNAGFGGSGGGGGASTTNDSGGAGGSGYGGTGGGGGANGSGTGGAGGDATNGGAGGGGGSDTGTAGAGGTSLTAGNGGAGANGASAATAGTAPGGGGGGSDTGDSGAGADGWCRVTVI